MYSQSRCPSLTELSLEIEDTQHETSPQSDWAYQTQCNNCIAICVYYLYLLLIFLQLRLRWEPFAIASCDCVISMKLSQHCAIVFETA